MSVDREKGKGFLDDEKVWILKSVRKERRTPEKKNLQKRKKVKIEIKKKKKKQNRIQM